MTNNLKELTMQHHENAERAEFADLLLSGDISPKLYQEYLYAQLQNYTALESAVSVPMELESIFRSTLIEQDLHELQSLYDLDDVEENLQSTIEYTHHIRTLEENGNNDDLLGHLYVRHFGDAHGGQIIKKKVPGSGLMYEFEDRKALIQGVRELLHDGMADEAKICFEYAERLFHELIDRYNDRPEKYESAEVLLAKANNYDGVDEWEL
jgi:heme oxygenase